MQLETSVFIPIKTFLFSEADCDSRGKCQVFVIHVQGSGLLMERRRGLDAHRGQHPPGWVLSGHSTEAESRSGNSSWWKTLLPPKKVFCCHLVASVVSDCATLWAVARQAPLSVGFSRQEYWSGLPWLPPGDLPNPGTKPRSPTWQAASLPSEPPGKPKYTRVGSLSLLQGNFPIQESNWGLLNYRRILYQLRYQGSP